MVHSNRGMTWHKILSALLIIWAILEPLGTVAQWTDPFIKAGLSLSDMPSKLQLALYIHLLLSILLSALYLFLFAAMRKQSSNCVQATKNILIFSLCYAVTSFSVQYYAFSPLVFQSAADAVAGILPSILGVVIFRAIIFIPTYHYLRKRYGWVPKKQLSPLVSSPNGTSKMPESESIAEIHSSEAHINPIASPDIPTSTYCRVCGQPLRNDSAFCEHCGTKV